MRVIFLFIVLSFSSCKKCGLCRLPTGSENGEQCESKHEYDEWVKACEAGGGTWIES